MAPPSDYDLAHTYHGMRHGDPALFPQTVLSHLVARADRHGSDPYLTLISEERATTLSYADLEEQSRRIAAYLLNELQVEAGDVVGLIPANDVESVVAMFGVLRTGCAVLLLNPADPPQRIRTQLSAVSAKRTLRSPAIAGEHVREATAISRAWTARDGPGSRPHPNLTADSPALFFGTSGSTAASKIVAQSHYNAAANAYAVCTHHRLRRGDRLLGCLPFHHVNGVHFTLLATLASGAHAVVVARFDPFAYLNLVSEWRPRLASVVPTVLEALLDADVGSLLSDELEYFVSAAAPLSSRTAREVAHAFGVRVHQGYGLTETTNFSTTIPAGLSDATYRRIVCDAEIPSIGTPLYGNEMTVLRADGERADPGEIGELCMRGHNVMIGYAGNAAATADAFRGGWFHSQDLGSEIVEAESGRRLFAITGRIKNIAKVGGEAVSLEEMERTLLELPYVRDAACVTRTHRLLGDEILALVVTSHQMSADHIRNHLRATFAPAALPRAIVRVSCIPRTPTGKIRRTELAQLAETLAPVGAETW